MYTDVYVVIIYNYRIGSEIEAITKNGTLMESADLSVYKYYVHKHINTK